MQNLADDIPPVKVSIPISQITKTRKAYIPHTRETYDPHDSADIAAVKVFISNFFSTCTKEVWLTMGSGVLSNLKMLRQSKTSRDLFEKLRESKKDNSCRVFGNK
jgi:hypothetical protein